MIVLIILRGCRSSADGQLVTVDPDQRPDLPRPRLPQPRLAPEEAVLALKITWCARDRGLPTGPLVGRFPDLVRAFPAVVIDPQQQGPIGQPQDIPRRMVRRPGLDPFRGNPQRLPGLAPIGRAMHEPAGHPPLVSFILGQQVPGQKQRAVGECRQVRLTSQQVGLPWSRPASAPIPRAEQQHSLADLVPRPLVLVKSRQQQFARGEPRQARLVVVGFAHRDPFAVDRTGGECPGVAHLNRRWASPRSQQPLEGNSLEHHLRLAPLVHQPHMCVVDLHEAGVARPAFFVEQQAVCGGPCQPVIKTDLQRVMRPPPLTPRIGEHQHVPGVGPGPAINPHQAPVAVGLDQCLATGGVRLPGLAQVGRDGDRAKPLAIVPHRQHQ